MKKISKNCEYCLFNKNGCISVIECENFNIFEPNKIKMIKENVEIENNRIQYKKGDKVIVKDEDKSYVAEIIKKYNIFSDGEFYDVIRIFDKNIFSVGFNRIECKLEEKEAKEDKKYLKTWEAIKALEEGKEGLIARRLDWLTIECGSENYMFMKNGKLSINGMIGTNHILNDIDEAKWILEEPKKEIPKEFEGLKYILGSINNMNCDNNDCDECPLGIDNCNKLDEVFFDMKEKYNF